MKAMSTGTAIRGLAVAASLAVATPMMATGQGTHGAGSERAETSRGGYDIGRFAEQARELGLTPAEAADLQQRVDEVVAETGGMQIGINKVLSKDGSGTTIIPLPSENVEQGAPYVFGLRGPLQMADSLESQGAAVEPFSDCCNAIAYSTEPRACHGYGFFQAYDEILKACDISKDGWWVWVTLKKDGAYGDTIGFVKDENGNAAGCGEANLEIDEEIPVHLTVVLSESPSAPSLGYCCRNRAGGKS